MGNDTTEKFTSPPRDVAGDQSTGDRLGKYTLLTVLGKGASGVVWSAQEDPPLSRRVAVKILIEGCSPGAAARFQKEGPILAGLRHPGIAEVYDTGKTPQGQPYQVMEYVDGRPLSGAAAGLTEESRLELFASVCDAVAYANSRGVVHRDLKPANVLVTTHNDKPHAKLVDFGAAKELRSVPTDARNVTLEGQAIGTLGYMSPEQAQGLLAAVDRRCDVYALGVMLCELVTGKLPMDFPTGESERQSLLRIATHHGFRKPSKLRRDVPRDLETIVLRATDVSPARRYDNAGEIAADVRNYLAGVRIAGGRDSVWYTAWRDCLSWMQRNTAMTATLLAVLATLVGVLVHSPILARYTKANMIVDSRIFTPPTSIGELQHARLITLDDETSPEALAQLAKSATSDAALVAALDGVNYEDNGSLRLLHAALIEKLARAKPNGVLLDIIFRTTRPVEDPFLIAALKELEGASPTIPAVIASSSWAEPGAQPALAPELLKTPGVRWGAVIMEFVQGRDMIAQLAFKYPGQPAQASAFLQTYAAGKHRDALADVTIDVERGGVVLSHWVADGATTAGRRAVGHETFLKTGGLSLLKSEAGDGEGAIIADWKVPVPANLDSVTASTWSYARALQASPEELAAWCEGRVVVVGDARSKTPSGKTDLLTFADGRVIPGPCIATLMVEHLASSRPTRVPNIPEAVVILAIAASAGVFIGMSLAKRWGALWATLLIAVAACVGLAMLAARMLAYECGPLIPSMTLLTGALLAAVVFSRFVRVRTHTITLSAQT